MRVQIPAYHDMWMKGDRWGDVVSRNWIIVDDSLVERVYVKLDKSGKRVRVLFKDCTVVDVEPRL
jgi:hypothetical protein